MPKNQEFEKIFASFVSRYGAKKGEDAYSAWLSKKGYDDTKPLSGQKKESKEHLCLIRGVEIKEGDQDFHVYGLIATDHVDEYDQDPRTAGIPDLIPKVTLDSMASYLNQGLGGYCGVHHSEGRTGEYGALADTKENPAKVVELADGHYGLYVDTKVLKNDAIGMKIVDGFKKGDLNSFSITYDTDNMQTVDFEVVEDKLVRVLTPETKLFGYTAASHPVNPNAIALGFGYKEFKEIMVKPTQVDETKENNPEQKMEDIQKLKADLEAKESALQKKEAEFEAKEREAKEKIVAEQAALELKAKIEAAQKDAVAKFVESKEYTEKIDKMVEEKAKLNTTSSDENVEVKEFLSALQNKGLDAKEKFRYAGNLAVSAGLLMEGGEYKATKPVESKIGNFKTFTTNGRFLEMKGLAIGSNASTYTQAQVELDDVFDPMIWNLLNQDTVLWNFLNKEDKSKQGSNNVTFRVKIGANPVGGFYSGNEVTTGSGVRAKYQTKFKKVKFGVELDGDMKAAAKGSSIGDVWNVEIASTTEDMLSSMNKALYAEKGLETAVEPIGMEYLTDAAGNTTLYGETRTAANGLRFSTTTDNYVSGSAGYSQALVRPVITALVNDGSKMKDLFFVCNKTVGDFVRAYNEAKFKRIDSPTMTRFGFETALFIDGIPVLEDKDCNTDDLFLVDKNHLRIVVWVPPTLELLGKRADSDEGFIKSYYAVYSTAPRRIAQIYGITSAAS
jgi:hypothetical protein